MMRMTLKRSMPKMTTTLEVRINMKYSLRFGTKYIIFFLACLSLACAELSTNQYMNEEVRINMKYSIHFGTKIYIFWRVFPWVVLN